jgi:hypothetical protein
MTQQHPITPPPELIKDWHDEWNESDQIVHSAYTHIAIRAAQWGADQELEACCEWLKAKHWIEPEFADEIRADRRPKPPSLKEQALAALERYKGEEWCEEMTFDSEIIRCALEQLDD